MNTQNANSEIASKALATLVEALEAGNSAALTACLAVMSRFHRYSWTNCLLISMQRPNATRVAGLRAWLGFGRHVRKGEKGIAILAPIISKVELQDKDQRNEDESTVQTVGRVIGFRTAYVFDVSQTEGQELVEFSTVKGDPQHYLELLKRLVASEGISLDYDGSIAPAKGFHEAVESPSYLTCQPLKLSRR